ncbi:MAG: hypothetical protein A2474_02030 [Elusimicrobia bacterium RIFOXYC2_FULL_34_12]|nr:MAG: hypothetical protein A2474_02030 [Elusimicrobia bacterium RIFOXYC2_FULL_34_12]HAM38006.1 hypothetical protein [Elusimicrobiota bacterium]
MGKEFKTISHTDDLGIVVYGKNLKELFESAAFGMFSLIARPIKGNKRESFSVTVTSDNTEYLLMDLLNELQHYYSIRKILLCSFRVMLLTKNKVNMKITGERISKHNIINNIISAKYHDLKIVKTRAGYKTEIIFEV